MHDLVIRGGTVVDGTGGPPRTADVAVRDGRIIEVGRVSGRGRREIAEAMAAAADSSDAKGLSLHIDIAPGAETVWADPTGLRQMLANLVDNAGKHGPPGTPTEVAEIAIDILKG